MPGGAFIICDNSNHKVKRVDQTLSVIDSLALPDEPSDVAVVDNSNVIVTMPFEEQLKYIQVLPSLKKGRTFDVGVECQGIAVAAGKIFVSNYAVYSGEIRVYDIEGKKLGTLTDGSVSFSRPAYVAVSRSGDKIFEPSHGKTNNLHRRKQRRRSASR